MKKLGFIVLFVHIFICASSSNTFLGKYKIKKIVIDAGHGGIDHGTSGKISKEKNITLKIAKELGRIIKIKFPDIQVLYTRTDDSFPTLYDRADKANKNNVDVFISIHCNWAPNPNVYGGEIYVIGLDKLETNFEVAKRENSVILLENNKDIYQGFDPGSAESYMLFNLSQNTSMQNSILFAQKIEKYMKAEAEVRSRGIRHAAFWVLYQMVMPSVLIEVGFLSNPKEEKELNNPLKQYRIAKSIATAFEEYKKIVEKD
ncbi:MAG: N-acetylmuramoyl-L-alanine amidase [Chitinophagaceae bacterium]|nr:N-acetylmuramoyl-L-alanine amidase [Chitinophagaceae bacterium]